MENNVILEQFNEQSRKRWIKQHINKGKAYNICLQTVKYGINRFKEDKILKRKEWWEPYATNSKSLISGFEFLSSGISIINNLRINNKGNNDNDYKEILKELIKISNRVLNLMSDERRTCILDVDKASVKNSNPEIDDEECPERIHLKGLYSGSPYLTDDLLNIDCDIQSYNNQLVSVVNYSDTVAEYLKFLSALVNLDEFEIQDIGLWQDKIGELLNNEIVNTVNWIQDSRIELGNECFAWRWCGFAEQDEERIDEFRLAGIIDNEEDSTARPSTYYTSRMVSALARLYFELSAEEDRMRNRSLDIDLDLIKALLKSGLKGLLSINRVEKGWSEIDKKKNNWCVNDLYPTVYAFEAIVATAYYAEEIFMGTENAADELSQLHRFIFSIISTKEGRFNRSIEQIENPIQIGMSIDYKDIIIYDECFTYTLFKSISNLVKLCKQGTKNASSKNEVFESCKLKDSDMELFHELATYILHEKRNELMVDAGFPCSGLLSKDSISKFVSIRASARAMEAFLFYGISQDVNSVSMIIDNHLTKARKRIIEEIVEQYGELERKGIRVAWGLIESETDIG